MVADGFAERDREEVHQGRLRRYYKLTDSGVRALQAEVARLSANVRAASAVEGLPRAHVALVGRALAAALAVDLPRAAPGVVVDPACR